VPQRFRRAGGAAHRAGAAAPFGSRRRVGRRRASGARGVRVGLRRSTVAGGPADDGPHLHARDRPRHGRHQRPGQGHSRRSWSRREVAAFLSRAPAADGASRLDGANRSSERVRATCEHGVIEDGQRPATRTSFSEYCPLGYSATGGWPLGLGIDLCRDRRATRSGSTRTRPSNTSGSRKARISRSWERCRRAWASRWTARA
jgi:hypothetical protein